MIGKKYTLKETVPEGWNLAWHGTLIENLPSILKNGLRKTGEWVEGKEIDIRKDKTRLLRRTTYSNVKNWSEAIFMSSSIFYSCTEAYAEHFKDFKGEDWIIVLEV